MTGESAEPARNRQREWVLIVRRSFGIPDVVAEHDAKEMLVGSVESQLHENGWPGPARSIARPIVEALIALSTTSDSGDRLQPADLYVTSDAFTSRDAAHLLINKGMSIVDPENLVFSVTSEHPREILEVTQQTLERISGYLRGSSFSA